MTLTAIVLLDAKLIFLYAFPVLLFGAAFVISRARRGRNKDDKK